VQRPVAESPSADAGDVNENIKASVKVLRGMWKQAVDFFRVANVGGDSEDSQRSGGALGFVEIDS
jgi:hypothetical protein